MMPVAKKESSDCVSPQDLSKDAIATEPQSCCVVCGREGEVKYRDLPDRLFGAPGMWNFRKCGDPGCGALWLDPRPTREDIGKAYACYYTHQDVGRNASLVKRAVRFLARERAAARYGYATSKLPWPGRHLASGLASLYPGLGEHLDLMIRYLNAPDEHRRRLLDVGCGDGEALDILRLVGWDVVGVELDEKAVASARARGLDVRQGQLDEAGFAEYTFDVVTSSHVIEHVHDPLEFLKQQWRVLKPGGCLIAVTPNADGPMHRKWEGIWFNLDPPRHLTIFTRSALQRLASAVGFSQVEIVTTARAVALAEIASTRIRHHGAYRTGTWPGLGVWLKAQSRQWAATLSVKAGIQEGEELVLIATK